MDLALTLLGVAGKTANQFQSFFPGVDPAFELRVFRQSEHAFELRSRPVARIDQIPARHQQSRPHLFGGKLSNRSLAKS